MPIQPVIITSDLFLDGVRHRLVDTGMGKVWEKDGRDAAGGQRWEFVASGTLCLKTSREPLSPRDYLLGLPPMRGTSSRYPGEPPRHNARWLTEEYGIDLILYRLYPNGAVACSTSKRMADDIVISVARFLGRKVDAIAYRLANFGWCDPEERGRGVKHLGNMKKIGLELWNQYASDPEAFVSTLPQLVNNFRGACGHTFEEQRLKETI